MKHLQYFLGSIIISFLIVSCEKEVKTKQAEVVLVSTPSIGMVYANGAEFALIKGEVQNIGELSAYNVKINFTHGVNKAVSKLEPSTIDADETVSFSYNFFGWVKAPANETYDISWD